VATEYMQQCQHVQNLKITVTPNNSGLGLADLESGPNPPDIAMYDGTPGPHTQVRNVIPQAIGDIIFAMVGNDSLPGNIFQQGPGLGLTSNDIEQAFAIHGSAFDGIPEKGSAFEGIPGITVQTVGRPQNSGTRETFIVTVAGGNSQANGAITESSTMDLLGYINENADTIGYAEADALRFFPHVHEIAIDGVLPSPQAVEDGTYKFRATEHLYTKQNPSTLTQDFIAFLASPPVVSQLQANTSFLGCSTLAGTMVSGDCQ